MYRFRDTLPIDISRKTISGDLVTIENPEEMGVVDSLEVSLEPIQDLNGYDHPWVGGAGKNKLPTSTTKTSYGVTFTANSDGTVTAKRTTASTNNAEYDFTVPSSLYGKQVVLNGCPSGGADSETYRMFFLVNGSRQATDYGNGVSYTIPASPSSCVVRINVFSPFNGTATFKPMIRLASETDATYEPYENICPISGHDSVDTNRTGKNLLDASTAEIGTAWNGSPNSARARLVIPIKPNTDYVLSMNGTMSLDGVYSALSTVIPPPTAPAPVAFPKTINSGDNTYLTLGFNKTAIASTDIEALKLQLELGSTATTYEPYQGNTYTTDLGRTVYGGTLDVVSGELVVDRAMVTFDGSEDETWFNNGTAGVYTPKASLPNVNARRGIYLLSNQYEQVAHGNAPTVNGKFNWNASLKALQFRNDDALNATAFRTALANNPVQICYELATPQTYQLTPQQIDLLLGTNHLWSDGEISVVWHKDLTKGRILPTEAVSINGQYIENVLDGYRTLYTKGRESLGAKLETYSVGTADGEKFKNKRYPARTITVGFQLIGANPQDFRQKFNNLNNLLAIEEADFIFNDETDKFFSGYPIMDASVEEGQDSVKGEWKIYCVYPFKRSVEPIKLTMEDATVTDTTATFTIDYKGARPARPVLRAKFAGAKSGGSSSEDGDCGFVAFMDGEENIIQLGNPEILDLDEYVSAETFINKEFVNVSDWTRIGGHTYKGTVTGSVSTSNATDTYWGGGAGQTQTYAKPSYGSGSDLHGAILWKNTAGAVNFTMNMVHRICCANPSETGVFECGAYNHETGVLVAGFIIDKSANGTTGIVRYIVNDKQVGTDQIDLSYYNTHFGYCNRTPVYVEESYYDPYVEEIIIIKRHKKKKKIKRRRYITKSKVHWWARTRTVLSGWNYTQSNLNSSIQKDGSYVYFQVGNLPLRTFNVPAVAQVLAHDASVYMGTYGTALNTNMIHSLLFRRDAGVPFAEQPNVFTAGDIVEADCNEATVNIYRDGSIGGHLEPQYGALGNDWESFMLTSGTNVIRATWSEWVNTAYKPQIEIEYNEVFI